MKWIACALVLVGASGCYTSNLGPVVTDVHLDGQTLRYTRCDLLFHQSSILPSAMDLDHCVNEHGKPAKSQEPLQE